MGGASTDGVDRRPSLPVYVGVALASGAAIAAQVAFTRVFAISLWHHFAYLVIGIALLGFGVAGSYLTARGGAVLEKDGALDEALARRAMIAAIATLLGVAVLATVRTNALALFRDPSVLVALTVVIALAAVPFFGTGVIIGTALSVYRGRAGSVYAADLLGAGAGAAVTAAVLHGFAAPRLLFACAAVLALASLSFAIRASRRQKVKSAVTLAALVSVVALYGTDEMWVRPAPAKEINAVHWPDIGVSTIEHRAWTPQGRIDVTVPYDSLPMLGGEINFTIPKRIRAVTQDGAAPTALYELKGEPADLGFFPWASTAALWEMKGKTAHRGPPPPYGPDVLIIGFGGGVDGLMALAYGARTVTGVDINPAMIALHTRHYKEFTGALVDRPGVRLVQADGRAFVRAAKQKFHVIQLSGVDTFTALAGGAYTVAEAYVYTREAFEDYFEHLGPGGCVQVSRLILNPPRETLRLAASAAEAMRRRGWDPARQITVVHGKFWGSLIACERVIDISEMRRLRDWAALRTFQVGFDPLAPKEGAFTKLLTATDENREAMIASYPFRLDPATDEAPFFFDYYKWGSVFTVFGSKRAEHPYAMNVPIGHGLLLGTFLLTGLFAALGILRPLRRLGVRLTADRRRYLLFFAGLGFAFLFVEAALLQRLTFLLGHPTHAMTVVLGALLVASGLGAACSRWLGGKLWRALPIVLVVGIFAAAAVSYRLLPGLIHLPLSGRVLVSLVLVVPLGFVMGMPFPVGLERLRSDSSELVPWAFGVNAFFTVMASSIAPIIAMQIGFSALLPIAAVVYLAAFLVLRGSSEPKPASESEG